MESVVTEQYFEAEGCWITEYWNTPRDDAVSIARARVEPGAVTRRHKLSGIAERYLILEGQGRATIGAGPAVEVAAGDVLLIPPGVTQCIANTGPGDLIFLAICTPRFQHDCYENVECDRRPPGTVVKD